VLPHLGRRPGQPLGVARDHRFGLAERRLGPDVLVMGLIRVGVQLDRALVLRHSLPQRVASMAFQQVAVRDQRPGIRPLRPSQRLLIQPLGLGKGIGIPTRLVQLQEPHLAVVDHDLPPVSNPGPRPHIIDSEYGPLGEWSGQAARCFARLMHRPVRALGGPAVRAAGGGK
jgi:hypothetical protein